MVRRHGWTRMNCKQGVSGVLGGVNLAKHSQTVSFVCATKKRLTVWVNAARTTPLNTPTPPLKKNSCFPGGLQKKWIFFSPHPSQLTVFSFQRLFEFLNLIRNQVLAARFGRGLQKKWIFFSPRPSSHARFQFPTLV